MVLRKLAISNFRASKVRVALTVTAIALAVSLVVAVTSGYASMEAAAFKYLNTFLGSTDAQITRANDPRGGVRESLTRELAADANVARVSGRLEMEAGLVDLAGKPIKSRPASIVGVRRPDDRRVEQMQMTDGAWFDRADGDVAVVDQVAARVLKDPTAAQSNDENGPSLKVGDSFTLPISPEHTLTLKIVGIVRKPAILASQVQTIYLPIETLQRAAMPAGAEAQVTRILIDLKDGVSGATWSDAWKKRLKQSDPNLKMRATNDNHNALDRNLQALHALSYLGGTVSMLAAAFIVFGTLSMGVAERQRSLAMLRAVGAPRSLLGQLVVTEGMILATLGIAVGVPLGIAWVYLIGWRYHDLFIAGVHIERLGIAFAAGASLLAALFASLLPAWSATRMDPLEAMSPLASPRAGTFPFRITLLGLVLASLDSIISFAPLSAMLRHVFDSPERAVNVARSIQFFGHFAVGLPALFVGFFLLAPAFVIAIERGLGPIVAPMFGMRFALLRQQLSGGVWRAAGTCGALMVGLAILVVMQTQGNSMLQGWKLPTHFPDIFMVSFKIGGLNEQEQQKLETIPGIRPGEVMAIAIATPEFGSNIFALAGASLIPDATMFFGVEPDRALRMLDLNFLEGSAESARDAMKANPRRIIVTEEFRQLKDLHIGDVLPLKTAKHGTVDYTICGVVQSPGLDVIDSMFDLGRQLDQRTAASVFGSMSDAREDFGVQGAYLFAANLELGTEKKILLDQVKQTIGAWGMRAGDVREIKFKIQQGFYRLLLLVSTVAFAAMAVASLGVTNTIMAAIRSRRWQFGIFRSIGVTRAGLVRLVLAEAVLLGTIGVVMGLLCGFVMSLDAGALNAVIIGYSPPTIVPWGMIGIGAGIIMLVSILASLGPAMSVSREEPLNLLQAGRAAA